MDTSIPQNPAQSTIDPNKLNSQPVDDATYYINAVPLVKPRHRWFRLKHGRVAKSPGIYVILNTANHKCYVGSAKNLAQRKQRHFKDLQKGIHTNKHLQHAYNFYGLAAFRFYILEYVDHVENLLTREQHYIDGLKPEYNIARKAGSTLGIKLTDEQKSKLIAAHIGKKLSLEHRAKISEANRGRKKTREEVEKVRSALLGRKLSAEQRAQISATLTGKKQSPELIEKRIAPIRGTRWSEERRAKILAAWEAKREAGTANVGNPLPQETRVKISTALKGKKKSPEAIEKSATARRGMSRSAETKEKIRLSKVGKKLSPEVVEKRASKLRGKPRPPEVIEKMKATLAAKRAANLAEQQANQPPLF